MSRHRRTPHLQSAPAAVAAIVAAALLVSCGGPAAPPAVEVQAALVDRIPDEITAAAWRGVPAYTANLLLQDLVDPRLLTPSTPRLTVQAITDGRRAAFRLAWEDRTDDDLPGTSRFSDACAIQIPRRTEPDVPDPQMGQPGRPVDITYWRASWQAWADGRPDEIRSLYPGAVVDHYPFDAPALEPGSAEKRAFRTRYAPAEALDRRMEGPRDRPVQDLVAEGPGSTAPAAEQRSTGRGTRGPAGWEVVLVRPLPDGLVPGGRSQVAFAVWDGGRGEAGSRKMRTGWVPLSILAKGGTP